nr:unnamed protein product [Haemonchus contortus]
MEWLEDDDHDIKTIFTLVQIELKRLDSSVSDIEYELTRAEKIVIDEEVQNKEMLISVFNKTTEKLGHKMDDIASKLVTPAQSKKISLHR